MPREQDGRVAALENSLVELAVETWRLTRLFTRVLASLDAGEARRYSSQLRYFQKRFEENLESAGLRTVDLQGQPFDPGIAASAVNLADFKPEDQLLVDQMIEPIIMGPDGVKKQGTIIVRNREA